ncbi:MAG: aldolase/citrate lyase family protein [Bradyrhizobium sp.]
MTTPRLTRCYLAVPAHRTPLVQKAAASAADAVFMDLEDAVPLAEKTAALAAAADALTTLDWGRKTVSVRLNAIDSPSIQEIETLGGLKRINAFIVPKAETVSDVAKISQWITAAAGQRDAPVEMELLIETARGLVNVEMLAAMGGLVTAAASGCRRFRGIRSARAAPKSCFAFRLSACRQRSRRLSGGPA